MPFSFAERDKILNNLMPPCPDTCAHGCICELNRGTARVTFECPSCHRILSTPVKAVLPIQWEVLTQEFESVFKGFPRA
jgi:hypothetical protein